MQAGGHPLLAAGHRLILWTGRGGLGFVHPAHFPCRTAARPMAFIEPGSWYFDVYPWLCRTRQWVGPNHGNAICPEVMFMKTVVASSLWLDLVEPQAQRYIAEFLMECGLVQT